MYDVEALKAINSGSSTPALSPVVSSHGSDLEHDGKTWGLPQGHSVRPLDVPPKKSRMMSMSPPMETVMSFGDVVSPSPSVGRLSKSTSPIFRQDSGTGADYHPAEGKGPTFDQEGSVSHVEGDLILALERNLELARSERDYFAQECEWEKQNLKRREDGFMLEEEVQTSAFLDRGEELTALRHELGRVKEEASKEKKRSEEAKEFYRKLFERSESLEQQKQELCCLLEDSKKENHQLKDSMKRLEASLKLKEVPTLTCQECLLRQQRVEDGSANGDSDQFQQLQQRCAKLTARLHYCAQSVRDMSEELQDMSTVAVSPVPRPRSGAGADVSLDKAIESCWASISNLRDKYGSTDSKVEQFQRKEAELRSLFDEGLKSAQEEYLQQQRQLEGEVDRLTKVLRDSEEDRERLSKMCRQLEDRLEGAQEDVSRGIREIRHEISDERASISTKVNSEINELIEKTNRKQTEFMHEQERKRSRLARRLEKEKKQLLEEKEEERVHLIAEKEREKQHLKDELEQQWAKLRQREVELDVATQEQTRKDKELKELVCECGESLKLKLETREELITSVKGAVSGERSDTAHKAVCSFVELSDAVTKAATAITSGHLNLGLWLQAMDNAMGSHNDFCERLQTFCSHHRRVVAHHAEVRTKSEKFFVEVDRMQKENTLMMEAYNTALRDRKTIEIERNALREERVGLRKELSVTKATCTDLYNRVAVAEKKTKEMVSHFQMMEQEEKNLLRRLM